MANRSVVSPECWAAMRELREVYGAPISLISRSSGVNAFTIHSHARRHGWGRGPVRAAMFDAATIAYDNEEGGGADADSITVDALAGKIDQPAELAAFLVAQVGGLLRGARHGRIDKARIDAVTSMIRMVEKAQTLAQTARLDEKTRSDDELADIFDRINARIIELAREYAGRLVAQKLDAKAG